MPLVAIIVVALLFVTPSSIQTDGVISDGEWSGSEQYNLGDGNLLMLKQDGDALYAALISTTTPTWAHFYLSDGNRVRVMHASAALGAIEYKSQQSLWRTADKGFVYELRDREYSAEKMDAYYSKNGWTANNNNLGDHKTIEARINLNGFKPAYFSCVMAKPDKFFSFPAGLKDDVVLRRLVEGYAVDSLKFSPTTWQKISK